MDTSHLDHPYASALSPGIPSIPSIPGTRASSSPASPPAPVLSRSASPPSHLSSFISHNSQDLAELLRKAGSLSASPESVQAMIDLGAPADDIVKFTAWMEGKLNGSLQ